MERFSPKLRKAMDEIKDILKKHDIAASVVLHEPGFVEYLMHLTPSYSCCWIEGEVLRFRAKDADYNGDRNAKVKAIADTTNMLNMLGETIMGNGADILRVSVLIDKEAQATHFTLVDKNDIN